MTDQGIRIDDIDALQKLLNQKNTLLLDFDGPIGSVFAGFPARIVADQLRDLLRENGCVPLPLGIETTHDPFEVFIYAASLIESEAKQIQAALSAY